MADKTYRMTVSLSDGSTIDAGTFVAPQGQQGPQGPSGALPDWVNATTATMLSDGVYIIAWANVAGIAYITRGSNVGFVMQASYDSYDTTNEISMFIGSITDGKFTNAQQALITQTDGNVTLGVQPVPVENYKYIKIK